MQPQILCVRVSHRLAVRAHGFVVGLTEARVDAGQAAQGADPEVARAVGAMGLGLAAETGGVCVDIFGFRVRDPADLIIRAG